MNCLFNRVLKVNWIMLESLTHHTAVMIGIITVAVVVIIFLRKALKIIVYIFVVLILVSIVCVSFNIVDSEKAEKIRDKWHNDISEKFSRKYVDAHNGEGL